MTHWKVLLCFLGLFFLGGCALVAIGPAAYVEPPELLHSDRGHLGFSLQTESFHQFDLLTNAAQRPLTISNGPSEEDFRSYLAGARYSLSPDWEIGLTGAPMVDFNLNSLSYVARLVVKYRLTGDTSEKRDHPGWRSSVYAHLIDSHVYASGDQAYLFGPGGYGWRTNSDFYAGSLGISWGYRFRPQVLAYIGATDEEFQVSGSVHQDATGDHLYPAADFSFGPQSGSSRTVAIGLIYGVDSQLGLVGSHTELLWGSAVDSLTALNLCLAFDGFQKQLPHLQPIEK